MNDAVMNELGGKSQQIYFKCPSADDLAGLGTLGDDASGALLSIEPAPLATGTAVNILAPDTAPSGSGSSVWPWLTSPSQPASSGSSVWPWLTSPSKSAPADNSWSKTLVNVLDTTVKAGAPAATAYINYTAAQQALRNQPIQIKGQPRAGGVASGKTNYTPWLIGGLAVAGLLVVLTVFSAKKS